MSARSLVVALVTLMLMPTYVSIGRAQEAIVPGRIAFVREGGIWVWENGETTRLLEQSGVADARWSPDGESLLFVENGNSYSDLVLLNVKTGIPTKITNNQSGSEVGSLEYARESVWAFDPSWSASGVIGYATDAPGGEETSFALWLMDGPDESTAYAAPLLTAEDSIDSVSLSGDGTIAAYVVREPDFNTGISDISVWLRDLATGETFLAAQSGGEAFDPAISPDGQSIAVAIREEGGTTDVWLVDRATLERRRVTRDAEALAPAWSSDGQWLAYLKLENYQFEVWVAPVSNGEAGKPFKLLSARELDSRSGLSWWVPPDEPNVDEP
jgi:Tol biopolymer transport system component